MLKYFLRLWYAILNRNFIEDSIQKSEVHIHIIDYKVRPMSAEDKAAMMEDPKKCLEIIANELEKAAQKHMQGFILQATHEEDIRRRATANAYFSAANIVKNLAK